MSRLYSDADWGGDLDDRKSTIGFSIYVGNNLICWGFKEAVNGRSILH